MSLIIYGKEIPCDVKVVNWHEHGLTFKPPMGCKKRDPNQKIDLVLWHHTAGEGGFKQVYRVLLNRELSVQFYISQDGIIYQYTDVDIHCYHGNYVNKRSLGVEIASKGAGIPHPKYPRDKYSVVINGRKRTMLKLYDAQLKAALALAETLSKNLNILKAVPKQNGTLISSTMTGVDVAKFAGHMEHIHINPRKIDAGMQIMEHLNKNGY